MKYKPGDKIIYYKMVSSRDKYAKVICTFISYTPSGMVKAEFTDEHGNRIRKNLLADNVEVFKDATSKTDL